MTRSISQGDSAVSRALALLAALVVAIALVPLAGAASAHPGHGDDEEHGTDGGDQPAVPVNATDDEVDVPEGARSVTLLHDTHFHGSYGEEEPDPATVDRLAGATRFGTARLIAADTFGESDTVIVASGQQFPDALAGNYLAGLADAPILLVARTTLPEDALAAMDELGVTDVILVGGVDAIGAEVEQAIAAEYTIAERISGFTRYETAAAVATSADEVGTWDDEATAILATGEAFPDALAAGAVAFSEGFPVLLTPRATLHPAAQAALTELGIERVIIPGGPAAVSDAVAAQVTALGAAVTRINVDGGDRFTTAAAFAAFAGEEFGYTYDDVNVATGFDFADALTVGPRAGRNGNPLLLTNGTQATGSTAAFELLEANACDVLGLTIAGGTAAVSDANLAGLVFGAESCGVENIGRYMRAVQDAKDSSGETALFLGNGDDIAPSLLSGVFSPNGIHMIEALNASPIDVNTFGNHEFDYGPENLRELLAVAEYPYVTANVRDIATGEVFGADLGVEEFVLLEVNGLQVGITGLAPQNMASVTSLGDETEQIDAVEALELVVPKMQAAGADIIVVSSHLCGTDARTVADTVEGVHTYVGDHCAEVLTEPYLSPQTGAIVSLVGDEFANLGALTLYYLDGEVIDHELTLTRLADEGALLRPLPAVQQVVDRYNADLDEQLNIVIGERTVDWDTTTTVIRTGEGSIGNFITDEMRAFHDADIAVQNSGGIRANQVFEAGDITRRDIAEILPFANTVVKAELSGATILAALERSVDTFPAPSGAFLQVSGMTFTFDPSAEPGERIVEVLIGGEPLDLDRRYTMATNDFTLAGGDAYTMFAEEATVLVDANEGPLLSAFLIERIGQLDGPVSTDVEGRITALD